MPFLGVLERKKLEKIMGSVYRPREEFLVVRKWLWCLRIFIGFLKREKEVLEREIGFWREKM